jgi:epoxide hydrolase-like predicted phosphatase
MLQVDVSSVESPLRPGTAGVIFDMGGVLTVDRYEACAAYAVELVIPSSSFAAQLGGQEFADVEAGAGSMRDYLTFACRDVETRFGVRVDIRRLADVLAAGQCVRPPMLGSVGELAARGVVLGLLTNNAKEARSLWSSGVLGLDAFAAVVDSSELGVRKPDPEIFRVAAECLGLVPGQLLFFDDTVDNAAGAVAVGMTARRFTSTEDCRRICREHGLL